MSRYILHQAVACGGTARGFNQGKSENCAVYASEWLSYRVNGQSDPFSRTDPVAREFTAVVRNFPALYQGEHAMGDQVAITVADNAPKSEYEDACTRVKAPWGKIGAAILVKSVTHLCERIAPRFARVGQDQYVKQNSPDYRGTLLAAMARPGLTVVTLSPVQYGPNHMVALHVTDTEFAMFDPLAGELTLSPVTVPTWFDTPAVQEYFTKRAAVTVTPLTLT